MGAENSGAPLGCALSGGDGAEGVDDGQKKDEAAGRPRCACDQYPTQRHWPYLGWRGGIGDSRCCGQKADRAVPLSSPCWRIPKPVRMESCSRNKTVSGRLHENVCLCVMFSIHNLPYTLEMHRANLDNFASLFAFQDTISSASCHSCNVEKLCSVDHMVIFFKLGLVKATIETRDTKHTFSSGNAETLGLNLKAKASFVFPQSGGDSRFHSGRSNLTGGVEWLVLRTVGLWLTGALYVVVRIWGCCSHGYTDTLALMYIYIYREREGSMGSLPGRGNI